MISSRSLLRLAYQANERSLLKASKMTLSLPNNDVLQTLSSPSGEILTSEKGSKRIVTLNRPKALNALNLTMIREFYPLLKKWDLGGDTTLVIVKGAGDKAFCAGGDVLAAIKSAKEGGTVHKDFFREEYYLNHLIGTLRIPYVAFIDGIVMGGGCGLSVNGRFRVATEKTLLAMPETALGLFPDVGGSYFLPRLKGRLGIYLALTGYRLKAADAVHVGLATHYVPSASLPALEDALVALPDDKVNEQTVDATIRSLESKNPPPFSLLPHVDEIARTFDARSVEGIISKLEQEKTEWSRNTLKTLETLSPTSLKVTFRQMQLGARTSFAKVFTMEYRLTQRFLEDHDFFEGCRAILIEKDRNPRWKPAKLSDVTDEHVEAYFAPLKHPQELVLHED